MKSGRPIIRKWLSKYINFPIATIVFGGTQGYNINESWKGWSINKAAVAGQQGDYCALEKRQHAEAAVPGPNYFLDFMSERFDEHMEFPERYLQMANRMVQNSDSANISRSGEEGKMFETLEVRCPTWRILRFVAERILMY